MSIEGLINKSYHNLNENDKMICEYILNNKDSCYKLSINEFSKYCNVSQSTICRFAKKLELSGFSELKAKLRLEKEIIVTSKIDLLNVITDSSHKMIDYIKNKNCNNIFEKIRNCSRIIVYASGYSQARVASEFKRIFLPTGKNIFHIYGFDMVDYVCNLANKDDFVVIISLSGESHSVIELSRNLKLRKINTLSITKMNNNTLSKLCDENLYINSIQLPKEYTLNYEISTLYFILIEILYLKYHHYLINLEKEHFFIK